MWATNTNLCLWTTASRPLMAVWTLITRAIKILHERPELINSGAGHGDGLRLFIYLLMRSSTHPCVQFGYQGFVPYLEVPITP